MKDYNFKIICGTKNKLKQKTFKLKLKNKIDPYDMFEEVKDYLENNYKKHFDVWDEDYVYFTVSKGKLKVDYEMDVDFCQRCGTDVEIWGSYEEEE